MTIAKVTGLERFATAQALLLDTDVCLDSCRHCGSPAGFREDGVASLYHTVMLRVGCSNGSCAIATPFHYRTREDAAYAWNRKPGDPAKR